eukprot:8509232-Pyramimonas_sp.AAC.1
MARRANAPACRSVLSRNAVTVELDGGEAHPLCSPLPGCRSRQHGLGAERAGRTHQHGAVLTLATQDRDVRSIGRGMLDHARPEH